MKGGVCMVIDLFVKPFFEKSLVVSCKQGYSFRVLSFFRMRSSIFWRASMERGPKSLRKVRRTNFLKRATTRTNSQPSRMAMMMYFARGMGTVLR